MSTERLPQTPKEERVFKGFSVQGAGLVIQSVYEELNKSWGGLLAADLQYAFGRIQSEIEQSDEGMTESQVKAKALEYIETHANSRST